MRIRADSSELVRIGVGRRRRDSSCLVVIKTTLIATSSKNVVMRTPCFPLQIAYGFEPPRFTSSSSFFPVAKMPGQSSIGFERHTKRMRLGTKSCKECRRRKVRCIFAPNEPTCQECILHGATCAAQNSNHEEKLPKNTKEDLQQRLDQLEGVVSRLCKVIIPNSEPLNLTELETQAAHALTRLRPEPNNLRTPLTNSSATFTPAGSVDWASTGSENDNTLSTNADLFEEGAPLLQLFQEGMMIQRDAVSMTKARVGQFKDTGVNQCVSALRSLLPDQDDMMLILELTEPLWPLWPLPPTSKAAISFQLLQPTAIARECILGSLDMGEPAVVAQCILWFALCIQQVPGDFEQKCPKLPASPSDLISSYLSGAEDLLLIDEAMGGSIDGLEGLRLKSKIFINMGKPRKAWMTIRHGLNQAMLLGLHRLDVRTDQRKRTLWSDFWQLDRNLSMILGFPCAIADTHPSLSIEHTNGSNIARLGYRIAIISGRISERDQNHHNADYDVTINIARELDECRKEMPEKWWGTPSHDTPLAALYGQQTAKIMYFQIQKYLHLPYMLKSTSDSHFISSRDAAVHASRETIKAYQDLRNGKNSITILCDLMDFQVFSAAMVIIMDLLSYSSSNVLHERAEDWEIVSYTASTLKRVSEVMDCAVARQAADVLQYFLHIHDGSFTELNPYEAVIPYFGRVRISQMPNKVVAGRAESSSGTSSSSLLEPLLTPPSEMQFSLDPFLPLASVNSMEDFSDAELNVDWTALFDGTVDYEFNQVFGIPEAYGT